MLASIFSLNVLQTALELGCIYALVAQALTRQLSQRESLWQSCTLCN